MMPENDQKHPLQFGFSGEGGEYFRIWIVNLALTILTLGVYSAWAKVRRLQYFYRNTSLNGASFDYHGNPVAILKGRLIGIGLLLIYQLAGGISPVAGLVALAALMFILPWLIQRSLCFKLANSSYRGLRFRFDGSTGGAYRVFLLWPALGYLTAGLLMPLAHRNIKAYQHGNSRYGTARFGFNAGAGGFYAIYVKFGLMLLLPIVLFFVLGGTQLFEAVLSAAQPGDEKKVLIGLILIAFILYYLAASVLLMPWFTARMQNLVWNATTLEQHGFASTVKASELFVLYLTNFLGILFTLGLFKPFADIRLARYRLEHMALLAGDDLDAFVADQAQNVGAAGEETAEVFDLDISF